MEFSVLTTALSLGGNAQAQQPAWPERPIKLIVPYAPGGGTDLIARTIANKLSSRLGQPIIIDNRGGAGGALGIEAGIKAAPDGYTLLFTTSAYATIVATGKKLPYDPVRDIAPIGSIGTTPLLVAVPNSLPVKTLGELIDLARTKPNGLTYGSGGVGAMSHLGMEMLAAEAKVQFTHIPYKGMAPAFNDLMAGHLQAGLTTFATANTLVESGKVRGLAVTSARRSPFAPQIPTTAEAGFPGFQIDFWWGLVAPARVPSQIVKRLNGELNEILAQPEMRDLLAREGGVPAPSSTAEFGKLIAGDIARWTRLVKDRNIKTE
ncbi:tripartite tricarboxylate transporter substrate binding protein [Azohydromonas australica]|uniref:tripartite tricarboxylate transporter substrate binding protein n=1 Tax=Azohydromonas australica TaxID=364039 RepID=UPI0007E8DEFB|nr:tripartite tricarboxylate transporter substrate binding protein [Azohydromonas australica]